MCIRDSYSPEPARCRASGTARSRDPSGISVSLTYAPLAPHLSARSRPWLLMPLVLLTSVLVSAAQDVESLPDNAGVVLFQVHTSRDPVPVFVDALASPFSVPTTSHSNLRIESGRFVPNVGNFYE